MLTLVAAELVAAAAGLGDTVNSIVEWYRPGSSTSPSALADGVSRGRAAFGVIVGVALIHALGRVQGHRLEGSDVVNVFRLPKTTFLTPETP